LIFSDIHFGGFARNAGNRFFSEMKNYVFSRSLPPGPADEVVVIPEDAVTFVRQLQPGRARWLFGGHALAASLLQARPHGRVTLAIHPILLGGITPSSPTRTGPVKGL
jgi:dihydrofolate reductase